MRGSATAQDSTTGLPPEPRAWLRLGAPFRSSRIKAQAEALRRSEERFHTLLQHSSDAVVVVGRDLR
ncbi:MAG: hypothetical protein QOD49_1465, partial [Actinomycetota bacterium]|nr:hypothetical protein [Actinomycetota bacterium]